MGESGSTFSHNESESSTTSSESHSNSTSRLQPISLVQPSQKNQKDKPKVLSVFQSVFRAFPIINPKCKFPTCPAVGVSTETHKSSTGNRVTGTLFGFHKGKLALQTNVLQKELSAGMVRIVLECEKQTEKEKIKLFDEPLWTMYCNGKKLGMGIMELLKAVSMGAGVLPGNTETEGPDGELAYMRAFFERVVGSKDSQTFYMVSPDAKNGPELSIFLVRI
ncbi:hypothetical protein ES332_D12G110500v1 [Gossypium tomentosum]|uniref:Protein MIZU-KUSSEI 1 n=1 Tax=Gossypium tomentosum TaxID=34277 RepID=A0A5D2I7N7_GOSTO|nr:hypothetical protein ES332_D12G110500v1 [Gossypium tomentosum]